MVVRAAAAVVAHTRAAEAACAAEAAAECTLVAGAACEPAVVVVVLASAVVAFAAEAAVHVSARGRRHQGRQFVRTPVATLRARRFAIRDPRPRAIRQEPQDST